jgi:hypothetical protein
MKSRGSPRPRHVTTPPTTTHGPTLERWICLCRCPVECCSHYGCSRGLRRKFVGGISLSRSPGGVAPSRQVFVQSVCDGGCTSGERPAAGVNMQCPFTLVRVCACRTQTTPRPPRLACHHPHPISVLSLLRRSAEWMWLPRMWQVSLRRRAPLTRWCVHPVSPAPQPAPRKARRGATPDGSDAWPQLWGGGGASHQTRLSAMRGSPLAEAAYCWIMAQQGWRPFLTRCGWGGCRRSGRRSGCVTRS